MKPVVMIPALVETVVMEMLQLSRLHMVGALRIPEQDIQVKLTLADGKLFPEFSLSTPPGTQFEAEHVRQVMSEIWDGWGRDELTARLRGLREERLGCARP